MVRQFRISLLRRVAIITLLALPAGIGRAHSLDEAAKQEIGSFNTGAIEIVQYRLAQQNGPAVEYFISKPKQPSPLVLFIQGSGCAPVFIGLDTANRASTVFSYVTLARQGQYAVMVVNKPFAPKERPNGEGAATSCPDQFNEYFTLENWVRDLRLAFDHAQQLPFVATGRTLVLGLSEGATVASALAAADSRVSHVALLGASGPTQFYDFVVAAYKSSSNDDEAKRKLDELDETRRLIFASPNSSKDFAWGHPYKRWSSFFRASSTNNLLKSQARIYIASGMQDVNVPILSTESMASELLMTGRDVTFRRVPNAGHDLLPAGAQYPELEAEYWRIIAWFEKTK
ncbi:MAG TPA: prolyl oligopeptidase family serine peptidase [Telluria sp.]|nr:prolyl oligopeptidase family serine peptidase [Telluria sp.]